MEWIQLQDPAVPSEHFLLPGGSARTRLVHRSLGVAAWHTAAGEKELEFSMVSVSVANSTMIQNTSRVQLLVGVYWAFQGLSQKYTANSKFQRVCVLLKRLFFNIYIHFI